MAQRLETRWRDQPLAQTLDAIAERSGSSLPASTEEPLFIFSAGWRSGSTLTQRLVNSGDRYIMWGEPYARSELVVRLADSLRPISPSWPGEEDFADPDREWSTTDRWSANLHPPLPRLLEAHRTFFSTLFGSASDRGKRWGFKEVRLSAEYAHYLALLFPRAKFIFLVRDPESAFASYKAWGSWYRSWPAGQVRGPAAFGRMWSDLAGSFRGAQQAAGLGSFLLRYEDLTAGGEELPALEAFLGFELDRSVLERRLRGSSGGPSKLSRAERMILRSSRCGNVAREFGYQQEA